jgi:hypothetical protein
VEGYIQSQKDGLTSKKAKQLYANSRAEKDTTIFLSVNGTQKRWHFVPVPQEQRVQVERGVFPCWRNTPTSPRIFPPQDPRELFLLYQRYSRCVQKVDTNVADISRHHVWDEAPMRLPAGSC